MANQSWIYIIFIGIYLVLNVIPSYQQYCRWLRRKLGYWNVLIPLMIMVAANLIGSLISGKIMVIFLIPLDIILLIDAIFTYFQIKKLSSK